MNDKHGTTADRTAFDEFITGQYAGVYQNAVIAEFDSTLPKDPSWKQ